MLAWADDEVRAQQLARDAATLTLTFTKPSGGKVELTADGRKINGQLQQTQLVLRKDSAAEELAYKSEVVAELSSGAGEEQTKFCCTVPELVLDVDQDKQWKQIGSDPAGLRLQVRFVKKTNGARVGFQVADIRATVPDSPKAVAIGGA